MRTAAIVVLVILAVPLALVLLVAIGAPYFVMLQTVKDRWLNRTDRQD